MAKQRSAFEGQLSFFEEPKPDPTAALTVGDRWQIVKCNHRPAAATPIWLPPVEVVILQFNPWNVTFRRSSQPEHLLAQWCLALEDFFTMARKVA